MKDSPGFPRRLRRLRRNSRFCANYGAIIPALVFALGFAAIGDLRAQDAPTPQPTVAAPELTPVPAPSPSTPTPAPAASAAPTATLAAPAAGATPSDATPPADGTFQNPIKVNGADPWLTYHDGSYYYTWTAYNNVRMKSAHHFADLRDAREQTVWTDRDPQHSKNIWAPECHLLPDDKGQPRWYLYYTASNGVDTNHRMYVAESEGPTPLGPYHFKAQLQTDPANQYFAIDGTVLRLADGTLYFLWAGRPSPNGQGLYISKMKDPWTLEGTRSYLLASGFGCTHTREAPETIQRHGKVFLVYSTCDTRTPDYKMGMLTADATADLLDPTSWKQTPRPVFQSAPENEVWGPGHPFFFQSPDGKEDWMVYAGKSEDAFTYRERGTRAQPFSWREDGTPDFGAPVPESLHLAPPSGE